jgi:hypothetical protein
MSVLQNKAFEADCVLAGMLEEKVAITAMRGGAKTHLQL